MRGNGRSYALHRPSPYVRELTAKHNLEEFQQSIREQLQEFVNSYQTELILEVHDSIKRKLVHSIICEMELRIQTIGDQYSRKLRIVKPQLSRSIVLINAQSVKLDNKQSTLITDLLKEYPIDPEEINDHLNSDLSSQDVHRNTNFQNYYSEPLVPPKAQTSAEIQTFRQKLPATSYRTKILDAISRNKVTIVTGGTGCGKTTQVPQFLLEEYTKSREPIRIICTQPRRLPAIAVAERVAKERGEQIADTVGYHIRLEQKTSENTVLTYCTSGVLLRMLSMDPIAKGITHIILDEVHEREQNTDYLLIILREALKQRDDLKLILMSATIEGNREMFETYFSRYKPCGQCDIPSRLYSVEKLYLPDILALTGYMPKSGFASLWSDGQANTFPSVDGFSESQQSYQQYDHLPTVRTVPDLQSYEHQSAVQSGWYQQQQPPPPTQSHFVPHQAPNHYHHHSEELTRSNTVPTNLQYAVQPNYYANNAGYYYDNTGAYVPVTTSVYAPPIQQNYGYDNSNWNMHSYYPTNQQYHMQAPPPQHYQAMPQQHSMSQSSALNQSNDMQNDYHSEFGARPNTNAFDMNSFLNESLPNRPTVFEPDYINVLRQSKVNEEVLIKAYLKNGGQQWSESIDPDLTLATIKYCMDSPVEGSILVFLPGYDDIINLREKVQEIRSLHYKPMIYTLHSQMNSQDQQQVFEEAKRGYRKVILSTNIAEASLTIDDVVFVVDCGKVKEKTYEHNSRISQLKVSWIAKSNAEQRAGRAGRCRNGYCFRLYSPKDYEDMLVTQVAEMRRSAIHELCLHAKMFAPQNMGVRRFLDYAPEPPLPQAIDRSLEFLEQLGALFNYEKLLEPPSSVLDPFQKNTQQSDPKLTNLGRLIANLPLDPQLARLLLFGVAMKVLYPVITLVASLAHRDPFTLPSGDDKMTSIMTRDKFSKLDYSDHLMLLRVLNAYSDCNPSSSTAFCRQNYLSKPAMTMIFGIRRQLFIELKRLHIVPSAANNFDDPEFNQFSYSWPMIQGVIIAGCYPGIAFIRSGSKLRKIHPINCGSNGSTSSSLASLHPSSSLRRQVQTNKRSDYLNECLKSDYEPIIECVVYQELSKIDEGLTLRTVTAVPPLAAFLFGGPLRIQKFIVDDFELGEEDYDAHFFVAKEEEDESIHAPNFDEEELLPQRYHREYYVETDSELVYKGYFRELQSALRLRFKLLSYFLNFLEKPLQPLSRENLDMLKCVAKTLEIDHKKCYFNEVNDTLPTRPLQRNNPPRSNYQRPMNASSSSNFVERRAYLPPPTIPQPANCELDKNSDSPPADPTPTIQPPVFDPFPPKALPKQQQQSSRNDSAPSKKILAALERAQKVGEMKCNQKLAQNQNNNYSNNRQNNDENSRKRVQIDPFTQRKQMLTEKLSNEQQDQERDSNYGNRNPGRFENKPSNRGRQFDYQNDHRSYQNDRSEQQRQYNKNDQRFDQQGLYVPPARRLNDSGRGRHQDGPRKSNYDVEKRMNDVKLDDKQNDDYGKSSGFGQRSGESSSFKGDRGGYAKVYKNQNFKRRGGFQ